MTDLERKPEGRIVPSDAHPGGFTIRIPEGLKPGESFRLSKEMDFSEYPYITPRIREYIEHTDGSIISRFGAVNHARPSKTLFINQSPESYEAITLLTGESFHAVVSDDASLGVAWGGFTFDGLDGVKQLKRILAVVEKSMQDTIERTMPDVYKSTVPGLAEWTKGLRNIQAEDAKDVYHAQFETQETS